jgi:NADPH-dependent 2,4-dienoyl-CoA reductase/sulfur reductase-like enzyme
MGTCIGVKTIGAVGAEAARVPAVYAIGDVATGPVRLRRALVALVDGEVAVVQTVDEAGARRARRTRRTGRTWLAPVRSSSAE